MRKGLHKFLRIIPFQSFRPISDFGGLSVNIRIVEDQKIKIIHETDNYLVIDKPAGLVVNRSNTAKNITLQDMIEERSSAVSEGDPDEISPSDFTSRSGIAHRLDKDTSGILLVAKNEEFFEEVLVQFKERRIEKEYAAVVHGSPEEDTMEIDAPIKRSPRDPMKMAIVAGGKEARTFVKKVNELKIGDNHFSYLHIKPTTGRTHQIRVHLAAALLYIAGDPIYCPRNLLTIGTEVFGRMMLHATKIRFFDPQLHEFVQFESPLPVEYLPFTPKI